MFPIVIITSLLVAILVSLWVIFYQLIKQQGRILLRLDQLQPEAEHAQPSGLAIGELFPSFNLPNITGQMIKLEDFRGKRLLLVYWSPGCGFCDLLAPDLAKFQSDARNLNMSIVLLARGDVESNQKLADEHGLKSQILLLDDITPEPFAQLGTPAAYVLDELGRVAKPLALGARQIPLLLREITTKRVVRNSGHSSNGIPGGRQLSGSRIERTGLKAGTPAPLFQLPDVNGRAVSLDSYRGRQLLLVFTDPHCGPCDRVSEELARLDQEHRNNGLAFMMVARGAAEENRRKTEDFGIEFPVVLQEKWKLSKEYGIFTTPAAFLVGKDGVIEKNVAVGFDAILELARDGLKKGKEKTYEQSH